MMNVEEALIELGDRPLYKSPYSRVMNVVLKALIPGEGIVTSTRTGQELLAEIYQIKDLELQEKILQKNIGTIRNNDAYKSAILSLSSLIAMGVIVLTLLELSGIRISKILATVF